jgi:hypothetical protein
MAEARLIQVYYAEEQKAHCFPFADLCFNERLTIFFENEPISRLVLASEDEKLAVCSWKLRQKLRWYIGKPRELTQEVLNSDYEVLSMTKNSHHHQMLASADRHHKGFKVAFQKICDHIGLKVPGEVKIPIYQNAFSARIDIYKLYVSNYLKPAMDFIQNDASMYELATIDSNYSQLNRQSAAKSDYLMSQIGFPYYPLCPFILERLFSVFAQNHKIKVTHL